MTRRLVMAMAWLAVDPAMAFAQGVNCSPFPVVAGAMVGSPAVAAAPGGSFVVAWQGSDSIAARRFDSAGTPLGTEFPISSAFGLRPAVAVDASGNFVVVWEGPALGIFGRLFDASGGPRGPEFMVSASVQAGDAAVAVNPAGDFVVAWKSLSSSPQSVHARRYNATGVPQGAEFQLDPATGVAGPSVAFQSTGPFVVVWQSYDTGYPVHGRRFDASGAPLGTLFQVSDTAALDARPRVAAGPGGDFVVAWVRNVQGRTMASRAFDLDGNARGPAVQVSTSANAIEVGTSIAGNPVHGYVVAWLDQLFNVIVGRRLDPAGVPAGTAFVIGTAGDFQAFPSVARGDQAGFVAVWKSPADISARVDCPARFHAMSPCRVADTRLVPGVPLSGNQALSFPIAGRCGIPSDALAVSFNATAVNPTDLGDLRLFPDFTVPPLASAVNFSAGRTRAGSAIVALGTNGMITVQCDMPSGTGRSHVVLDVFGYFGR